MNYDTIFFSFFENVYKLFQKKYGRDKALVFFSGIMKQGLAASFGNQFEKGKPSEFARIIRERDEFIGLSVDFLKISDQEIIYRICKDPFPNLQPSVLNHELLDACYMTPKIKLLLGSDWTYKTTKHFWLGDNCIEHIIYKTNTHEALEIVV